MEKERYIVTAITGPVLLIKDRAFLFCLQIAYKPEKKNPRYDNL